MIAALFLFYAPSDILPYILFPMHPTLTTVRLICPCVARVVTTLIGSCVTRTLSSWLIASSDLY